MQIRPREIVLVLVLLLPFVAGGCKKPKPAAGPETAAPTAPATATVAALGPNATGSSVDWISENNRGVGLMEQFDFNSAVEVFAPIAGGGNDRLDVRTNLGIALLNRRGDGDAARAAGVFSAVLSRRPGDLRAAYCTGLYLLNEGKAVEALAKFQQVAAADSNDAYAAYFAGQCFAALGKAADAAGEFGRAVALDPLLRSAWYGDFQALQQLGRNDDAARALAKFQQLADDPRAALAEFKYTRMGKKALALAIDRSPRRPVPAPAGRLFADASPLKIRNGEKAVWRKYEGRSPRPTITAVDIDGDGKLDLFITSALEVDGQIRNAVLLQRDGGFELDLAHPLSAIANVNAAVWGDFDNDGLTDVYFCRRGGNALFRQIKAGQWQDITESSHAAGGNFNTIDAAAIDADHDGDLDLVLIRDDGPTELLNNNLDGTFTAIGEKAGIAGDGKPAAGLVVADLNHDGLVDLVVLKASPPNDVFINDGIWKYHRDATFVALEKTQIGAALAADVEGSGQVSILAAVAGEIERWSPDAQGVWKPAGRIEARSSSLSPVRRGEGRGEGTILQPAQLANQPLTLTLSPAYRGEGTGNSAPEKTAGISLRTASIMRAAFGAEAPCAFLSPAYRGERTGNRGRPESPNRVVQQVLPAKAGLAIGGPLAVADLTGDGSLHLIASQGTGWRAVPIGGEKGGTAISQDVAAWALVNLDPGAGPSIVGLPAEGGTPIVWRPGTGRYPFVGLSLSGRRSKAETMRSNASGIGVQVAGRFDSHWSIVNTYRGQSGPGQSLQPISLGTGNAGRLDFARLIWPDGLQQTELNLPAGKLSRISEVQRQTSSCPVIFAWDGKQYLFVTDCLGGGGIGFATGPGEYAPQRPVENVLLPLGLPQGKDGRMTLKIGEPMEEACYLDGAVLASYDLPPGWSMTLDERMAINDPQPTGAAKFYRTLILPQHAVNDRNEDITAAVSTVDGIAAEPGERDPRFIGFTKPHFVEMTFSQPIESAAPDAKDAELLLLADGWIEYPYSQTMFAASQAKAPYRAPTLEAAGADGKWVAVLEQFGYPAGMPRQMSVGIPRAKLPHEAIRLRISTDQEIYWDRLALAWSQPCRQAVRHVHELKHATLSDVGFPFRTTGPQRQPHYDYHHRLPLWDTRRQGGSYTAFGDVDELLSATDDACVIFGPGEEVELQYAAPADPPAAGSTRRFVLELAGWCKDRDLYTKDGQTLTPWPAREGATADSLRRRDELYRKYNTR